jgi:hypothetical protein
LSLNISALKNIFSQRANVFKGRESFLTFTRILNNHTLHCQSDDVHAALAAPSFAFQHVLPKKLLQSAPVPQ